MERMAQLAAVGLITATERAPPTKTSSKQPFNLVTID